MLDTFSESGIHNHLLEVARMSFSVTSNFREFSAGEAAETSGVSQVLQREWRRRGLLSESKGRSWVRYSVLEVCSLAVMKGFSESGISVKSAHTLAMLTAPCTKSFLMYLPGAVAFEGDHLCDGERDMVMKGNFEPFESRYIFAPLPFVQGGSGDLASMYFFTSLAEVEKEVGPGWFNGLIFDLKSLAEQIHAKIELPLATFHAERDEAPQ